MIKLKINKIILFKIALISIIMLISISYSNILYKNIDNNQSIYYEVTEIKYNTINVQSNTVESYFTATSNNIIKYVITLDQVPNIDGNIGYEIYDNNGTNKLITLGLINMAYVKESKALIFDLNGNKLKENSNYKIILYFALDGNLSLREKSDGNLSDQQIIEFVYGQVYKNIIAVLNIILLFTLIALVIKPTIQKSFLLVAFVVGIIGIFTVPPYTAPDEYRHFARAFNISEGIIVVKDNNTSEDYFNMTFPTCDFPIEFHNLKLISESSGKSFVAEVNNKIVFDKWLNMFQTDFSGETIETPIHGASGISPIAYLPQVFFILIAKLFNMIPILVFYMARFGNVFFTSLIGYLVIKKIPKYKNIMFFLFFAPGLVFLRSTSSTDGLLFSLMIVFVAYIIFLKENKIFKQSFKQKIFIALLLICIASIKLPYVLCALLLLMLVDDISIYKKQKELLYKLLNISALILFAFFAYKVSSDILGSYQASTAIIGKSHLLYLLQHPIKVGNMLFQSFMNDTFNYFSSAITYPTSNNLIAVYTFALLFISLYSYNDKLLRCYDRVIILALSSIMWMAILVTFYFVGPQPDLGYIWGLQGRYILPIIPIVCLALPSEKTHDKDKFFSEFIPLIIMSISFTHIYQIVSNYWI